MSKYIIYIIFVLFLSGCSLHNVTKQLYYIDYEQTKRLQEYGFYEKNPLLGKYPDKEIIDGYFNTVQALHTKSQKLNKGTEALYNLTAIAIQSTVIANNYELGMPIIITFSKRY